MRDSQQFLNPSDAARRLGTSTKALRLYEQRGLIAPVRTAAGWRTYGPADMVRAAEIVTLRALGLTLAKVAQVLDGDAQSLEPALAAHQTDLENQRRHLDGTIEKVRNLRAGLAQGQAPAAADLARMVAPASEIRVALDLPWPWGGEAFELNNIRPLTYITGPLGSGKGRLAKAFADEIPGATFLGLERSEMEGTETSARLDADPALKARVDHAMVWLVDEGATESAALTILLIAIESDNPATLVVDLIEQGLDEASQEALVHYLRHRATGTRPIFMLTRSTAILDMATLGPDEAIILCPANHAPPMKVAPFPGSPGYEAVATCLASPNVRARTEGVIAWRPQVA